MTGTGDPVPPSAALTLPRLGQGGGPLGNLYRAVTDAVAEATIRAAWDAGLRYFDTAPHYGLGLSERRFGRALAGYERDSYVLSTKVGRLLVPNPTPRGRDRDFDVPDTLTRVHDYSATGVRRSLEQSLERLGLDRIDVVYVHDPEPGHLAQVVGEAGPELTRLRDAGVIRAWGLGSGDLAAHHRALDAGPDLLMVAGRYTLLEQSAALPLLDQALAQGAGVVACGVFASGILATDHPDHTATYEYAPAPAAVVARARRAAAVCAAYGVPLPAAAIQYPLRHPAVVNVTLGAQSPEQARQNVARATVPIPEGLWSALADAGLAA